MYGHPRDICISAGSVLKMSQQAAPANYPARRSSRVRVQANRRPRVNASRWDVRGSRLLSGVSAVLVLGPKSPGDQEHAKAAPLQAVGDRTSHVRATRFRGRGRRRGRERLLCAPNKALELLSSPDIGLSGSMYSLPAAYIRQTNEKLSLNVRWRY